jgi:type IV pilus assembly protein PilC
MNERFSWQRKPRMGTRQQMIFFKRLGMLLRSGSPVAVALRDLERESMGGEKLLIDAIATRVEKGETLSASMSAQRGVFNVYVTSSIKVGEQSGTLSETLQVCAEMLKRNDALRKKLIGAMVYPAVIVVATVSMTLALTLYLFPKITPIFKSFKTTLPWPTRAVMAASDGLTHYWLWCIVVVIAMTIALRMLYRKEKVRRHMDRYVLNVPIFGPLIRAYYVAQICRSMSALLESGTRVVKALEVIADSSDQRTYREALLSVSRATARGQRLSPALKAHARVFPSLMTHMIAAGEESGSLSTTCAYLADMYESDMDDLTRNLTTLLEPILMIVMGLLVGFIAIAIIMPIYGITQSLNLAH